MINFTESAILEIKSLMKRLKDKNMAIRLNVKGENCCGNAVTLAFDTANEKSDKILNVDGIKIVINKMAFAKVNSLTVDYTKNLLTGSFKFVNPEIRKNCDCSL